MRTVFTTDEVAKICKVAPRTVSKWFDAGKLRGYRIPGSQDRRIPREHLINFMKQHGLPLEGLYEMDQIETDKAKVELKLGRADVILILRSRDETLNELKERLKSLLDQADSDLTKPKCPYCGGTKITHYGECAGCHGDDPDPHNG